MKMVLGAGLAVIAAAAAIVFSFVVLRTSGGEGRAVGIEPLTTLAAPVELTKALPASWMAGLRPEGTGEAVQLSCLDADAEGEADGLLTATDNPEYGELVIPLDPGRRARIRSGNETTTRARPRTAGSIRAARSRRRRWWW